MLITCRLLLGQHLLRLDQFIPDELHALVVGGALNAEIVVQAIDLLDDGHAAVAPDQLGIDIGPDELHLPDHRTFHLLGNGTGLGLFKEGVDLADIGIGRGPVVKNAHAGNVVCIHGPGEILDDAAVVRTGIHLIAVNAHHVRIAVAMLQGVVTSVHVELQ